MLRLAIAVSLFLCRVGVNGAEGISTNDRSFYRNDHVLSLSSIQIRYEYLLSQTVFAGFPESASIAFYALPSFEPESGIWMTADGSGYLVVHARAKTNLWYWTKLASFEGGDSLEISGRIKAVRDSKLCVFRERTLSKQLGRRVEMAWHRALFGIRGGAKNLGLDGTTLIFRAYSADKGRVSWDAWTVRSDSLALRLQKWACLEKVDTKLGGFDVV